METRIEEILAKMTLAEKTSLLAGADMWHTVPLPQHGIPALKVTDGPNGVRGAVRDQGPSSAAFPVGIAVAATWNLELAQRLGAALAAETKAKGAHILLAPTVNLNRSPLAGRNFETYGEDPYLSGRLATAYIQGLQGGGVGACIKHFVCNDSEFERFTISSDVDERALRELYLTPFRMAIAEAEPWTVMSAYNRINGTYASEHVYLLRDILKGEWGFDGMVISDWYGTYSDAVAAGGLDLEMPGPARYLGANVAEQVRRGELDEALVDDKIRRLLRTLERVGAFDQPALAPEEAIDRPEDRVLARQIAREAIVLLKNEDNLLPLDLDEVISIAVIGENAERAQIMGGGSSQVNPHYVISPLDGIRERAGAAATVTYALGTPIHRRLPVCNPGWLSPPEAPQAQGVRADYFDNLGLAGEPVHTETTPRLEIEWFGNEGRHVNPDHFSLRLSGTFTAPESGTFTFTLSSVGKSRLYLDDELGLDNWQIEEKGDGEKKTVARQLDAGETMALVVEYSNSGNSRGRSVRLGCLPPLPADPIGEAVALAAEADVAIVYAGLTAEWESEGFDRPDMRLPGAQDELIRRVAAANPNTIVILNTGSPVEMPWLDGVPALLQVWYPGQEAGHAVADILFGDFSPSGRLPATFPRRLQDNPAYINYPGENGHVRYGEGLFIGYRYYDAKEIAPLFSFGHGLAYTTFAYGELALGAKQYGPGEKITATITVTNTGDRPAQEVVQLYVRDLQPRLARPPKELKRFAKIMLQPEESQQVTFTLDGADLAFYDPVRGGWRAEAGEFELLVGRSAADIRSRARFNWQGDRVEAAAGSGHKLHTGLPLKALLDEPQGRRVLANHLGDLLEHPQLEMALAMTLDQLSSLVPDILTPQKIEAIRHDLAAPERTTND